MNILLNIYIKSINISDDSENEILLNEVLKALVTIRPILRQTLIDLRDKISNTEALNIVWKYYRIKSLHLYLQEERISDVRG